MNTPDCYSAPSGVAAALRDLIFVGKLRPGAPLREAALSEKLGVSRNTLRETFQILCSEGLVELRQHRGASVKALAVDDVRDIFAVRRAVELRAVEESATAPNEAQAALREAADHVAETVERGDWTEVGTASLQFHQALVGLLASARIDAFFRAILAQVRLAFASIAYEAGFQSSFIARDQEICDLLTAGSRARAGAVLKHYLDEAEQEIIDALAQAEPAVGRHIAEPRLQLSQASR